MINSNKNSAIRCIHVIGTVLVLSLGSTQAATWPPDAGVLLRPRKSITVPLHGTVRRESADSWLGRYLNAVPGSPLSITPNSTVTQSSSGGNVWLNPDYAVDLYTTGDVASWSPNGSLTDPVLILTLPAVSIPTGDTIDGIQVTNYMEATNGSGNPWTVALSWVGLTLSGTGHGTASSWSGTLTSSLSEFTWGSSTDLWGTAWTPSDFNNGDVGIDMFIGPKLSSFPGGTIGVDNFYLTVWYS